MMLQKSAFFELRQKEEREKWDHLKKQVQKLLEIERKAIHQLISFNFIEMKYKEFEKNIESFSKILDMLNVMKRVYKFDCVTVSEQFISKQNKSTMEKIISDIGSRYEENISKIVDIWRQKHGS